jgi:hypothetical protein
MKQKLLRIAKAVCAGLGAGLLTMATYLSFCEVIK